MSLKRIDAHVSSHMVTEYISGSSYCLRVKLLGHVSHQSFFGETLEERSVRTCSNNFGFWMFRVWTLYFGCLGATH